MCEEPVEKPPLSSEAYFKIYAIYRAYALGESNLINTRLTWVLTINGFLFAAYSFTLRKELEVTKPIHESIRSILRLNPVCYVLAQADFLLATIALTGLSVSILGLLSILAAQVASHSVASIFKLNVTPQGLARITGWSWEPVRAYKTSEGHWLPDIRGGGSRISLVFGHLASALIPLVLSASWIAALYYLRLAWEHNRGIICSL